jgi:hypothetical protein
MEGVPVVLVPLRHIKAGGTRSGDCSRSRGSCRQPHTIMQGNVQIESQYHIFVRLFTVGSAVQTITVNSLWKSTRG